MLEILFGAFTPLVVVGLVVWAIVGWVKSVNRQIENMRGGEDE